jgi:hypothetical protein
MARSDVALRRARGAYERAHLFAALRALALVAAIVAIAIGVHHVSRASWLVAGTLAVALPALAWRGGPYRRGAFAGALAGLPPLFAPVLVFAFANGGHCPNCTMGPTLPCLLACFGTSAMVGILVGYRAATDHSSHRFALAAVAAAALTGLLGCATTGFGGALGVVVGLVGGSLTGWVVAGRAAHA